MSRLIYCGDCKDCCVDEWDDLTTVARCCRENLPKPRILGFFEEKATPADVLIVPPEWCPAAIYGKRAAKPLPASPFARADAILRDLMPELPETASISLPAY